MIFAFAILAGYLIGSYLTLFLLRRSAAYRRHCRLRLDDAPPVVLERDRLRKKVAKLTEQRWVAARALKSIRTVVASAGRLPRNAEGVTAMTGALDVIDGTAAEAIDELGGDGAPD